MRSLPAMMLAACLAAAASSGERSSGVVFQNIKVRQGDTLWGISQTYLKDPARWDQILEHNRLPSKDPTVALPGMVLRVPVGLIKESLRAAHLVRRVNRVLFRRKDTADWKPATADMELFRDDIVRTLTESKARVMFLNQDLLSLEANSMAVIKPMGQDYDVELKAGGVFVGRSKVVTPSTSIVPKGRDVKYSARVRSDLSTLVEVYKGEAAVTAEGKTVDVGAGKASLIRLGEVPSVPIDIPDLPDFESRAAEFDRALSEMGAKIEVAAPSKPKLPSKTGKAGDLLQSELQRVKVGNPVSGHHIQLSLTRSFEKPLLDKVFEVGSEVDLRSAGVRPGSYWLRVAPIDLLGTQGAWSTPKPYTVR